jgi:TonB-linked SusC/RagA family outer membrane protein
MKRIKHLLVMAGLLTVCLGTAEAQTITMKGRVTDALSGEGLPGVNVVEKNTQNGAITDIDGNYSLQVEQGRLVVFSFIGYTKEEYGAQPSLDVVLYEDIAKLEEVVVSGLASSVKRSNLANAVGTVSGEELTGTTSQPTIDGALYGKLTGVNIVASSGAPGGGIGMRLRGVSSIKGNNQPLFIIDGVYMSNAEIPSGLRFASGANRGNEENSANRLADLNPDDIESIEVLKGASAAAIYGTRANAGVVIITTKSGKNGQTRVNLSQDFGVNRIQNLVGVRQYDEELVRTTFNEAEAQRFREAQAAGQIFDYEEELYGETGFITNTNLSLSGGSEKTTFYLAGSLRDEEGIIKNTGFERKSIRLNLDHEISDRITLTSSSSYMYTNTDRGFTGNENEGGLSYGYNLAFTRPWVNLFPDEFGNYPDNPNASGNILLVRDRAINNDKVNRFIQGASLDIKLIQRESTALRLKANGGLDYFVNETQVYVPEVLQSQRDKDNGFIGVGNNTFTNLNGQSFLVFDKFLNEGKTVLSTQAGISYLNFERDLTYSQTTQLIPGQTNLAQGSSFLTDQNLENEEEFGLVLQQEANFDDKLIATAGIRADKSSLNGDPNKYYTFLKGSVAANLTNFDFWTIDGISQLKLRAAYGETGSSAAFGSLFTVFNAVSIDGQGGILINNQQGSPNLIPETSSEIEVGFDLGVLDNRISLEATYYNRQVKDLLFDRSLPASGGFTTRVLNDADLRNQGIELALLTKPVATTNLQWNSTFNFWLNRSEITRLGVPPFPPPGNGFGLGLGTFYIEEGAPITEIVKNVDGVPTAVGDVEPDFQLSTFNELTFAQALEFSFLLHWKKGGENLNLTRLLTDLGNTTPNFGPDGPQAGEYIEPAGYLRLREIALYYKLPPKFLLNSFKAAKIGVSGRNILTVTDYSSYDPEVSVNGSTVVSSGLEVTPYPSAKQYYFHLNLSF